MNALLSPTALAAAAALVLSTAGAALEAQNQVRFEPVYQNVRTRKPVAITIPNDGSNRRFLVLQAGQIIILPEDPESGDYDTFLDISGANLIENDFEEGLLNLSFHPKFEENGRFYIYYTLQDPKHSVVAELTVSKSNPDKADPLSHRVLLEVPQPYWNHNSGNMIFGPDGYLYVALGDGGKRDDPHRLAQNLFVLNGKILRIDVDARTGSRPYGIPSDNPFVKADGVRPEIWAYGLRNPWGLWFEPETGRFWCADVGQDKYEEINHIVKGGNYGWNFREGTHAFTLRTDEPPPGAKFVDPILDYGREDGGSITGGNIYRGERLPSLRGAYIYGDWLSGNVWALRIDAGTGKATENLRIYTRSPQEKDAWKITAICELEDHELAFLSSDGSIRLMTAP